MENSRKKMLDRVRAMLNTEGRTEAEMMAFLAKARELMATYEIDEKELEADKERATIFRTENRDPYEIKKGLCQSVARFTNCVGWGGKVSTISFAGLESDVIFATWLLETLQRFIMRAYQKQRSIKGLGNNNLTSASFVIGCAARIKEKLKELTPERETNALVLAELEKQGIKLAKYQSRPKIHEKSAMAGHKAGNHARFDRPVEAGGVRYLK